MAQTKRKRRTKHRGNAAGKVEVRGKTHKGSVAAGKQNLSKQEQARQRRLARLDQPPTWQSAAQRAGIAAVLFVVMVILVFRRPVAEGIALGLFVLVFYIPLGYFTDKMLYVRRQKQKARERDKAREAREK